MDFQGPIHNGLTYPAQRIHKPTLRGVAPADDGPTKADYLACQKEREECAVKRYEPGWLPMWRPCELGLHPPE